MPPRHGRALYPKFALAVEICFSAQRYYTTKACLFTASWPRGRHRRTKAEFRLSQLLQELRSRSPHSQKYAGPPFANSKLMKEWRDGKSKAKSPVIPATPVAPGVDCRIPDGSVVNYCNAQKPRHQGISVHCQLFSSLCGAESNR